MKSLKKVLGAIPVFIASLGTKVMGLNVLEIDSPQKVDLLYGVPMVSRTTLILRIVRRIGIILVPIVIIIGIIVYVKKRKKAKEQKENIKQENDEVK